MVGIESFRARRHILEDRKKLIDDELAALQAAPVTDERLAIEQGVRLMTAQHIMEGRLLEVDAWLETLRQLPVIQFPEQLPTKGNTPAYEPFTQKMAEGPARRERERKHRKDADDLAAVLPAAD